MTPFRPLMQSVNIEDSPARRKSRGFLSQIPLVLALSSTRRSRLISLTPEIESLEHAILMPEKCLSDSFILLNDTDSNLKQDCEAPLLSALLFFLTAARVC